MSERNVLGGPLQPCGSEPLTGFLPRRLLLNQTEPSWPAHDLRGGNRRFLKHQRSIGNDLSTPMPRFRFPGLVPGDRRCVTANNWLVAYREGFAAPVVLASTHERTLDIVPLEALREHAVDVPDDLGGL